MRFVKSLFQFLWDFFIGDTPELFVGACLAVGVAWVAHRVAPSMAIFVLPVSIAVVVGWSLNRSRRR